MWYQIYNFLFPLPAVNGRAASVCDHQSKCWIQYIYSVKIYHFVDPSYEATLGGFTTNLSVRWYFYDSIIVRLGKHSTGLGLVCRHYLKYNFNAFSNASISANGCGHYLMANRLQNIIWSNGNMRNDSYMMIAVVCEPPREIWPYVTHKGIPWLTN